MVASTIGIIFAVVVVAYVVYEMFFHEKPDPNPYGLSDVAGLTMVKFDFEETQENANRFHKTLATILAEMRPQALEVLGQPEDAPQWGFQLFANPDVFYTPEFVDIEGNEIPLNGYTKYYHQNQVRLRVFRDDEGEHMYDFGGAWSWELRNIFRYRLLGLQEFEEHETDEAMNDLVSEYMWDPSSRFGKKVLNNDAVSEILRDREERREMWKLSKIFDK